MMDKLLLVALSILCILYVICFVLFVVYLAMRVVAYFFIRKMMRDGDDRTYDEIVSDEFQGLIL